MNLCLTKKLILVSIHKLVYFDALNHLKSALLFQIK